MRTKRDRKQQGHSRAIENEMSLTPLDLRLFPNRKPDRDFSQDAHERSSEAPLLVSTPVLPLSATDRSGPGKQALTALAAARGAARRDYEHAIRRLALYCRRRDPRVASKNRRKLEIKSLEKK